MAKKNREQRRLDRRKRAAAQQATQFEDTLSAHELNLMRLQALPEDLRDETTDEAIANEERAIATLKNAIQVTLGEAGDAAEADES